MRQRRVSGSAPMVTYQNYQNLPNLSNLRKFFSVNYKKKLRKFYISNYELERLLFEGNFCRYS